MIAVVQAFDGRIARLESDDATALDRKIKTPRRLFANRRGCLSSHVLRLSSDVDRDVPVGILHLKEG